MESEEIVQPVPDVRDLIGEYTLTSSGCGLTERVGLSVLEAAGPDAVDFLQGMVTADIKALDIGRRMRAALLDTKGHILADILLLRTPDQLNHYPSPSPVVGDAESCPSPFKGEVRWGESSTAAADHIYLVTDSRCAQRLLEILNRYLIMEDVTLSDRTNELAALRLIGPQSGAVLESALGAVLPASQREVEPLGSGGWIVSCGLPELTRFDLWLPGHAFADSLSRLTAAGACKIGHETDEAFRVEAGEAVWGSELDESVLLPEAEIPDIVSYTKGCYVGQEIIARLHARGHTNRAMRRILFTNSSAPVRSGSLLYADGDDREAARITSAVRSVRYGGSWLALGYVRSAHAEAGSEWQGRLVGAGGLEQRVTVAIL